MESAQKSKLKWQIPFLLFLIIATIFIVRQQKNMPYQHNKGMIFGTYYSITYQSDDNLQDLIEKKLNEVDQSLSPFNKQSIITAINENRDPKVNEMFKDVFNLAMRISDATDGMFDITVAPLVNEWGFGFKEGIKPTQHVIDSLLQLVGYKKVSLSYDHIKKADPRIILDCSAIAKGYGCDVIAKLMKEHNVQNYMIEIGGEVVTKGVNEKRDDWRIGIQKPVDDTENDHTDLQTIIQVRDAAMATSGNYRRFYYKNGKKYAHTISPKTGYPAQQDILSATVIASSCAMADAYATAFMVMGKDKTIKMLEKHPELKAYLIYTDGKANKVWKSEKLKITE